MTNTTYPTARKVAVRAQKHFTKHVELAQKRGRSHLAEVATAAIIETMVDAAFWASLRREEGLTPKISLAYVSPEQAGQPLRFEQPLPLSPSGLAKLAPAVERPGIHLGVWPDDGTLRVWGTTRELPAYCFVIEVVGSGWLVIKHRAETFGKFVNVAVLEGDEIKIVDESNASVPDCPGVLKSMLGFENAQRADATTVNVLVLHRGVDARPRPGRHAPRRPRRHDDVAELDRGAGALLREPAVCGARRSGAGRTPTAGRRIGRRICAARWTRWRASRRSTAPRSSTISTSCSRSARRSRARRGQPPVERVLVTEPIEGSVMAEATPVAARRHAPPVGRAVRPRSARRERARRLAGRAIHDLHVVTAPGVRARASGRGAVALDPK